MAVYRNGLERMQDEWKTFKAKTFREKVRHIVTYEKHLLLILAVLVLAGFYGYDIIQRQHQELLLQGFFTNDAPNYFPAQKLQKEYAEHLHAGKNQRVAFEDALYIDLGGGAETLSSASNGKVIAYIAARELDFIVTERSVAEYYMGYLPLLDLSKQLPADLLEQHQDALRTGTNELGEDGAYALDLRGSRFVPEDAPEGVEFDILVPTAAPRPEAVWEFLRYAFDTEGEG